MDTKRLALAFALSAAVLILWTMLFPAPKPVRRTVAPAAPTEAAATVSAGSPAPRPVEKPRVAPAAPIVAPALRVDPIGGDEPRDVVVSTALYTARLSNRGGELVSFTLNRFMDSAGKPLDLVRKGAGFPGRTLGLDRSDPFLERAAAALSRIEHESAGLETTVRFGYREADGNGILRTYVFRPGYVVSVRIEREGAAPAPLAVALGPGLGNPSPEELQTRYTKPGSPVVLAPGGDVDRKAKDGLKAALALGKGLTAVGLEDNYFLAVFLPSKNAEAALRPVVLAGPPTPDGKATALAESEAVLSGAGTLETDLYLGPKKLEVLETVRPEMDRLIDYGPRIFVVLVKPLLFVLRGLYGAVRNWGVAIILITILLKVVLYPLTHKQLVSMKKMSRLQPKVETIRAKWAAKIKQDPQARVRMNEEMMGLYKTEGVNPAGGCLPLLLQMPILIAFYNLLAHAIELRHAPFALWISDLSAKDPYYVTPILMTITMWLQQQMTPAVGDPAQRRIMGIMPLIFGFLFKDLPSGLVLYWLVQNILTIAQQMLLNRYTDLGPASMKKAS